MYGNTITQFITLFRIISLCAVVTEDSQIDSAWAIIYYFIIFARDEVSLSPINVY